MSTVIIGAGIIGTSTAYYLSQSSKTRPDSVHLIESSPTLFASASGYAAGFLARDWFSPPLAGLGELSFDLHKYLAEENNGYERWGYSKSTGISLAETVGQNGTGADWLMKGVSRATSAQNTNPGTSNAPVWLKHKGDLDVLSGGSTTAQVDPLSLCQFLVSECTGRDVHLHQPALPHRIHRSSSGELSSVTIVYTSTKEEKTIPCTRLILAAGAWTPQVYEQLFPSSKQRIPITSLAGHSLIVRSPHWPPPTLDSTDPAAANPAQADCHAVFTTEAEADYSPELFSRMPDGHIYIAGLNSSSYPLPKLPTQRMIDEESIAVLKKTATRLLGDDFEVVREAVCWRPVASRGIPIVTELESEKGVIVAAGHGPWGISLSLGTGWCVAGMIEGRDMGKYVGKLGV